MDNELPKHLNKGDVLYIPKETYHRVIAGNGRLVVEIEEHED
jgi:ribosomal protein L16 Arg81 hydroxylase